MPHVAQQHLQTYYPIYVGEKPHAGGYAMEARCTVTGEQDGIALTDCGGAVLPWVQSDRSVETRWRRLLARVG